MKISTYLLIGFTIFASSCSDDDGPSTSSTTYQPTGASSYWNYKVETAGTSDNDSLYVVEPTTINGNTYHKMRADAPVGFYSTTLSNNAIRVAEGKLYVTGTTNLDLGGIIPLDLALNDFIILDANAPSDQQLSSIAGILEQDLQGFPLKITYELRSVGGMTLPNYTTPSGIQYSNVKSVKLRLNLKITTIYDFNGFPITITLMNPQDVVVSERFYAPNIGMVYSSTRFAYELQDFSDFNIELPIPQSGEEIQLETLLTYDVD